MMMKKWLLLKNIPILRLECKTIPDLWPKWPKSANNWYPIYDQNSRKTIPFGAAHTYIADIRKYPPPEGNFYTSTRHTPLNTKARYIRRLPWEALSSFANQLSRVRTKFNMAGDSNSRKVRAACLLSIFFDKNSVTKIPLRYIGFGRRGMRNNEIDKILVLSI